MHTIVVGAGSAGAVIAARLSESGEHEVSLVEAGPDYPLVAELAADLRDGRKNSVTAHDWGYRYRPSAKQKTWGFPRGRVVGGSSAVNTCIALRGHPYDYDEWQALGLDGWRFTDCLPAFKRLEHDLDFDNEWHGTSGPLPLRRHPESELSTWSAAFVEASRRLGYPETVDHNDPELPSGVGPHAMNKIGGERISVARAYLGPEVRRRPGLSISADTLARRIVFEGRRFSGLEVERGGERQLLRADRLVVAMGAIATPGLLLRSGIGPRAELARLGVELVVDSPSVGARLLDHPGIGMLLAPRRDIVDRTDPLLQVMLRCSTPGATHPFDLQIQPGNWAQILELEAPVVALLASLGKPRGHGLLRYPSADPGARPIIESRFLDDASDRRALLDAFARLYELARTPELAALSVPLFPPPWILRRRDRMEGFLHQVTGSGYHPSGTVPMSAEKIEEGALDARCRLRGVEGVYVADASVFPTIPSANTNLATIMVGERVGAWLRDGEA